MSGAAFFTAATRIPGRSKSAMVRALEPGATRMVRKPSAARWAGAKSTTERRAGSIATTATSQAFVPASSISFGIAAYSIMLAGTPALAASARPSSTVVPFSSPLEASFAPMIGFDVSTATRSVPDGASCVLASADGAGGVCAQPAATASAHSNAMLFMGLLLSAHCKIKPMLYDLILRGGRVIDPAQSLDGAYDVAIREGRIAAVLPSIAPSSARESIDVSGKLVLPGLIDTHAHVFQYVTGRFGLEADLCGVRSGVTTLVDQGGPSCMTLPAFREFVVQAKQSRVVAFLSAYLVGGMEGHFYPELYRPDCIDVDATVRSASENRDIVKGFKAHAELGGFARWGIESIRLAAEIGRQANLPVYIHFGQLWGLPESGDNGVV